MPQAIQIGHINPFAVTQAVDLSDEEIQRLWVAVSGDEQGSVYRPKSPMPLFLLGGKGSGKTHWMRYHSFALQRLRYEERSVGCLKGLSEDGYLGIYVLLGSLNAERFHNHGQSPEIWRALFAYYLELWLAQELLQVLVRLCQEEPSVCEVESEICAAIVGLLGGELNDVVESFDGCLNLLSRMQAEIDLAINNIMFDGALNIKIRVTPGQLAFGIPKVLKRKISALRSVVFAYHLDEFEIITEDQQKHINTLIRERSSPSTFRVGGRLWSIKTRHTYKANEENKEGSEFETWYLDRRFRQSKSQWIKFSYQLIQKRLEMAGLGQGGKITRPQIDALFDVPDLGWDSDFVRERISGRARSHLARFERKAKAGLKYHLLPGADDPRDVDAILRHIENEQFPLLEKVNILLLYQAWFRDENLVRRSVQIRAECRGFQTRPHRAGKYQRAVQHYGSDLLAQLFREERKRQSLHYGMKTFIRMSEGLPRSLLNLLKQIFDWGIYNRSSDRISQISTNDQDLGLQECAEWFLTTMRKSGEQEVAIVTAIERLGQLFEVNRFADKPVECSLLGFSVRERDLAVVVQERLRLAEQHSFLIRISRGEIDRNTKERISKFQLNALLGPKWDLPAARRGIARLKASEVEIVFDPSRDDDFRELLRSWTEKMTAPYFGRRQRHETPSLFDVRT
ncbi:hypothetical protein [Bradyrhizobium cajani]|uniref:Uncharacterized protein n=1 Tax=Bradyrhizobium cajani TaxID=1928661 RepID=A0A844TCG2_9BRAD|nr:hypothetical protein [Bradyrhizobium cajani]MCP3371612.1 hypothetical protein [Bradyrhizobium cajani]MVT72340.1 hypothetical protein [Bradyrhizobium cajani]